MNENTNNSTVAPSVVVEAYRLHQTLDPSVRAALASGPLDPDDFGLYSLFQQHQPVTAGDFAELSGIPPSTLTSVIRRFEQRGHLQRDRAPGDRRTTLLSLTPEGAEAHAVSARRFQAFSDRVHHHLGGHHEATRTALALVSAALVAATQPAREGRPPRPPVADTLQLLPYDGSPLSDAQAGEVQRFIRWLRWRDG